MLDSAQAQAAIGAIHRTKVAVRWGDQDAFNHVNNTAFFRYMEEARVQLFTQMRVMGAERRSIILVHASCDFLKPIVYPATVIVTQVLEHIGTTSIRLGVRLSTEAQPNVLYASAKHVMVSVDHTGQPMAWMQEDIHTITQCFTVVPT